jgi:YbgC/YbaW family acyl-CoA thioester hydrolase
MSPERSFEHIFQVPFHEVDRAGVIFFAHLFTHAHDAYERFMAHLGLNLDRPCPDAACALPIVHAEADYHAPLRHGVAMRVTLTLARLGHTSFTTSYDFAGPDHHLHARLHLVHCCVDSDTGMKRALPDALRARLLPYLTPPVRQEK